MERDEFPVRFAVPPEGQALRLDVALAFVLPDMGLRGRRRLWDWCRITVNGRPRPAGFTVAVGDLVRIEPESPLSGHHDACGDESARSREYRPSADAPGAALRLVAVSADFVALHKPHGLHSAHIAGGRAMSLESLLAEDWERLWRESGQKAALSGPLPSPPVLLTRLDGATSGIVLAAMNEEAAGRFRAAERQGLVEKQYFAVIKGRLSSPLEIRNRLDTNSRSLTLALEEDDPDSARHTLVMPLATADAVSAFGKAEKSDEAGATLVRVRIKRGARHQIRAHLAMAGFPLVGEWLYPVSTAREPGLRLYLHHAQVEFSGFSALDMPGWGLGEHFRES